MLILIDKFMMTAKEARRKVEERLGTEKGLIEAAVTRAVEEGKTSLILEMWISDAAVAWLTTPEVGYYTMN